MADTPFFLCYTSFTILKYLLHAFNFFAIRPGVYFLFAVSLSLYRKFRQYCRALKWPDLLILCALQRAVQEKVTENDILVIHGYAKNVLVLIV